MAISALNSGISALRANQGALDSSAFNVANASTQGFQPQKSSFQEGASGGVVVNISKTSQSLSAQANTPSENSGTDLGTEITNSLQYKIGFQIAAKLVQTSDEVLDTLLNLKK